MLVQPQSFDCQQLLILEQQQWEGDPAATGASFVDDLYFIDNLLTNLQNNYCIDKGRILASGMSNGGGFVGNILPCDPALSLRFAAFAPHSGAFYTNSTEAQCTGTAPQTVLTNSLVRGTCQPGRSNIPIIEIHGDTDGTISYTGGGRRGYCLPDIQHWASDWSVLMILHLAHITNFGKVCPQWP